jgi:hypothetical protein
MPPGDWEFGEHGCSTPKLFWCESMDARVTVPAYRSDGRRVNLELECLPRLEGSDFSHDMKEI